LFNAKSAQFQLYHGENKLPVHLMRWCQFCTRSTHLVGFTNFIFFESFMYCTMKFH